MSAQILREAELDLRYHKSLELLQQKGLFSQMQRETIGLAHVTVIYRPYSVIYKVNLGNSYKIRNVYIKMAYEVSEKSRRNMDREYKMLSDLTRILRNNKTCFVAKPVLADGKLAVLITEEFKGTPLDAIFKSALRVRARKEGLEKLGRTMRNVALWLRTVQDAWTADSKNQDALEEEMAFILHQGELCFKHGIISKKLNQMLSAYIARINRIGIECPMSFTHCDFTPSNVLIGDEKVCVLDIGQARTGPSLRDVACLIYSLYMYTLNPTILSKKIRFCFSEFLKGYGYVNSRENGLVLNLMVLRELLGGLIQLRKRNRLFLLGKARYYMIQRAGRKVLYRTVNDLVGNGALRAIGFEVGN